MPFNLCAPSSSLKLFSRNCYLISLSDLTDDITGCWVDGGESFSTRCITPLIVDEQLKRNIKMCHYETIMSFTDTFLKKIMSL